MLQIWQERNVFSVTLIASLRRELHGTVPAAADIVDLRLARSGPSDVFDFDEPALPPELSDDAASVASNVRRTRGGGGGGGWVVEERLTHKQVHAVGQHVADVERGSVWCTLLAERTAQCPPALLHGTALAVAVRKYTHTSASTPVSLSFAVYRARRSKSRAWPNAWTSTPPLCRRTTTRWRRYVPSSIMCTCVTL